MPIFMHKKIYLGEMAFAVPPKYIIEPAFFISHGLKLLRVVYIMKVYIIYYVLSEVRL